MDQNGEMAGTKSFIPHRIHRYIDGSFFNSQFFRVRNDLRKLKLVNSNFTLIANNCVSGAIYDDLGLQYLTPFVGLYIMPADFVKLCGCFDYYMAQNLEEQNRDDVTRLLR